MDLIEVYDLKLGNWLMPQIATPANKTEGIPDERVKPCSVIARAKDGSSYNIYMFGGWAPGAGPNDKRGYNDMWVLSIPSFKWFLVNTGTTGAPPKYEAMTCYIVGGGSKMLVYGGRARPDYEGKCDKTSIHVFDMTILMWEEVYDPTDGEYKVPKQIYDVIGGGPYSGATLFPENGMADSGMGAKFKDVIAKLTNTNSTISLREVVQPRLVQPDSATTAAQTTITTILIETIIDIDNLGCGEGCASLPDVGIYFTSTTVHILSSLELVAPTSVYADDIGTSTDMSESSENGVSGRAITGIIVGALVGMSLIILGVLWLRKQSKARTQSEDLPGSNGNPLEMSSTMPPGELHPYGFSPHAQELPAYMPSELASSNDEPHTGQQRLPLRQPRLEQQTHSVLMPLARPNQEGTAPGEQELGGA